MAVTNHERVGRGLTLLGQGLAPFVERECRAKWGDQWRQRLVGASPEAGVGKVNTTDPSFLLKAMGDAWQPVFRDVLGHAERGPAVGARRSKLQRWFWCASFMGRYDNAANSNAEQDAQVLAAWLRGDGPEPEVVSGFAFEPVR